MFKAVYVLLISAVIFACSQSKTEVTTEEPTAPVAQEEIVDNLTIEEPAASEPVVVEDESVEIGTDAE